MNRSNLEHAAYALLMQLAAAPFFGWWAGAWIALAYFWSREVAQRELYLKRSLGLASLDALPAFAGWRAWEWPRDAQRDAALPAAATALAALGGDWRVALALTAAGGLVAFVWRCCEGLDRDMDGY